LVIGASRFRWAGWQADLESLREVLATFPDADPALPFEPARCLRAVLRGGRCPIGIPREAAGRKGLFTRATFWDALMEAVGSSAAYQGYSYRERADRYLRSFDAAETARLRAAAGAVTYATLRVQIQTAAFTSAELYVAR
jgi:hypothetical protein